MIWLLCVVTSFLLLLELIAAVRSLMFRVRTAKAFGYTAAIATYMAIVRISAIGLMAYLARLIWSGSIHA